MSTQFAHVFSPLRIGPMTTKNRIVFLPHRAGFDGGSYRVAAPGPRHIAYWVERARHGVGWIATQAEPVHVNPDQDAFSQADSLARFKQVARSIHDCGAVVTAQLMTPGPGVSGHMNEMLERPTPWGPSAVLGSRFSPMPHSMTVDEIERLVDAYAKGARVLQEAGYDGAEIHACHGHLLNSFLSPAMNRRTDDYGGSAEKRLRVFVEIREAIRRAVGKNFALGARISGDDFVDGGNTLDEMVSMAPSLAEGLDYLSVGGAGDYRAEYLITPSMYFPLGVSVYAAAAIRNVVSVPVICSGRILDPGQAEDILTNGQADLIGMCRALIAEPEWVDKARDDRADDIRRCLGCNEGCSAQRRRPGGLRCVMNPAVGRETEWATMEPAEKSKKVVVVGGGPAGLEVARVAAARGHDVSLYEKELELGGMAHLASKAPGREDLGELARYYSRQLDALGVSLHLGTEATAALISEISPDTMVIATGSVPVPLQAPGWNQEHVLSVRDVLLGKEVGDSVVVVDLEYGVQALSAADLLASQGMKVQVITDDYSSGLKVDDVSDTNRYPLYQRLCRSGVTFRPFTVVKEIGHDSIVVANRFTGERETIANVDNVVYACGDQENNNLYIQLKRNVNELYLVGDCAGVRRLLQATYDGARVGRAI